MDSSYKNKKETDNQRYSISNYIKSTITYTSTIQPKKYLKWLRELQSVDGHNYATYS